MDTVEKGCPFAPDYETVWDEFDIYTPDWTLIAMAKFGPGRSCSFSKETQWSGDSFEYGIYQHKGAAGTRLALRWQNGSGKGWLTARDHSESNQISLLTMIVTMLDEARRWDACHFLWKTTHKGALAASRTAKLACYKAFAEGRLKKKKIRGQNEYAVRCEETPAP